MNWITLSISMFISSVILYLIVRKAALLKIPAQINNLSLFIIPTCIFLILGIFTKQNYAITFDQFLIILVASIFLSYLGNLFSMISIEYAPNPGYSLLISKSYVVMTTILAVIFFKAEFSLVKFFAISCIVVFSGCILYSPAHSQKKVNPIWLPLSIGAFFLWGFLTLVFKYLFSHGIPTLVVLSYMGAIVTGCVLIGFFSSLLNICMMEAIKIAPNIGYVNAINAASISAVTVCAVYFFKDEFSRVKFAGIVGVTIGLIVLLV